MSKFLNEYGGVGPAASWSQCIATHSAGHWWRPASFFGLPLVFDRLQLQAAHLSKFQRLSGDLAGRF